MTRTPECLLIKHLQTRFFFGQLIELVKNYVVGRASSQTLEQRVLFARSFYPFQSLPSLPPTNNKLSSVAQSEKELGRALTARFLLNKTILFIGRQCLQVYKPSSALARKPFLLWSL